MSTRKGFDFLCVVVMILAVLVTVLFMNGEKLGISLVVDEDSESHSDSQYFTDNDLNASWDYDSAASITFNRSEIKISGAGCYKYDGSLYITRSGYYVVSGQLEDGSIIVDAEDYSKIWILLNGVTINNSDNGCIIIENADKVFLTLAEGSDNVLSSGKEFSDTALEDGIDAAIFARDDLTINGSGLLSVSCLYKHGIEGNDDLVITGGDITINGTRDAIHVNNSFRLCNANVSLEGGDEGIDIDETDGYFYMESGTLNITSTEDGIHAEGDVLMDGGSISISSGDDGIHSASSFTINNGKIQINESYEGIEAINITINDGDLVIYSSDDGLNANGGSSDMMGGMNGMQGMEDMGGGPRDSDTPSEGEMPSEGEASVSDQSEQEPSVQNDENVTEAIIQEINTQEESSAIVINGGSLTIINEGGMDADGIDSNGDFIINGGDIRVSLSGNGSNSAIDYGSESGGKAQINGGTLIACGSYSMAESFDSSSTQASLLYTISSGVEAGSVLQVEDSEGNILMSYEVPNSFTAVNISCPEMKVGEDYAISINNNIDTVSIDEITSSYGDAQSGGFGGTMNFGGGMSPRDGSLTEGKTPPDMESGEMPEGFDGEEERPESPEGMDFGSDGERPEPPEGMNPVHGEGDRPQGGPGQQETEGSEQELPQMMDAGEEGKPSMNEEGLNENGVQEKEEAIEAEDEVSVARETITEDTLILNAAALLCLAFAFLFVVLYKKRAF